MSDQSSARDMQAGWRKPTTGASAKLTSEHLRARSQALQNTVQKRSAFQQAVIVLCMIVFAYYAWKFQALAIAIGCLLSIGAAVLVSIRQNKSGTAQAIPEGADVQTCVALHRKELNRQRDLLGDVVALYLLPFFSGMAFFLFGLVAQPGRLWIYLGLAAYVAGFVGIMKLNSATRSRIQHEVEELNRLEGEAK